MDRKYYRRRARDNTKEREKEEVVKRQLSSGKLLPPGPTHDYVNPASSSSLHMATISYRPPPVTAGQASLQPCPDDCSDEENGNDADPYETTTEEDGDNDDSD